jgi:hypothetical protein
MEPEVKPPVTLDAFEIGQLYVLLGDKGLGKLSPELRKKLKDAFEDNRASGGPVSHDKYYYNSTEEPDRLDATE